MTFEYRWYQNTVGMKKRLTRAEKRERTREELVSAAERLFTERGFHATTVDEIALEAGYTKGAVYSNFGSKEDLFFAVYERRVDRVVADFERAFREAGFIAGSEHMVTEAMRRRGRDDGWLAVFFEFWAHVVRRPELRKRFAKLHARVLEPLIAANERLVEERGIQLPISAEQYTVAVYAMTLGLSLERLTQPDVVDETLGPRMVRLMSENLERRDKKEEPVGDGAESGDWGGGRRRR
ncbi:transcriptional regulator, TetR family [Rubrobacter xylanophilus DSM 9941]|uniref:Transcriptional regulator, TetR family n=1 Tax=Rubrobacter xylanophilus (strain DSM 9941 / JCM 11954 / NBRC 16129 / PRD-1) TaxID=266117 RepID=Q1ARS2_RUBXD|nr:transcriptional regulator, TetR family [Rubrobacter xylanophilus DSM 9941]